MFNVLVEWLDEDKSRARFSLPGRQEWRAEHLDELIQLLAEIRADMSPPVAEEPPRLRITRSLAEQEELWKRFRR
jgi:hypothetical protein